MFHHIETSFYMLGTLVVKWLIQFLPANITNLEDNLTKMTSSSGICFLPFTLHEIYDTASDGH